MSLDLCLRLAGISLIILSLLHAVFWRTLNWGREVEALSPLSRRVFAVQTFFVAFVLLGLGLLSLVSPELLLAPTRLARFLLIGVVLFWLARLLLQHWVFDPVMRDTWTRHVLVRAGATLLWSGYVLVYGAALLTQYGVLN